MKRYLPIATACTLLVVISASLASCSDPCTNAEEYRVSGYEACVAQSAKYRELYAASKAEAQTMQGLTAEELSRYDKEQEFFLAMELAFESHCGNVYNNCEQRRTDGCLKQDVLQQCAAARVYSECVLENVLGQGFSEEARGHTCTHLLSSSKSSVVE